MTKRAITFGEYYKQMLDNLRARFPDIAVYDMVVCRQIYGTERDEVRTHYYYDEIVARLQHATLGDVRYSIWNEVFRWFGNTVRKLIKTNEQIQASVMNALNHKEEAGSLRIFPDMWDARRAIYHVHNKGYITYALHEWGAQNKEDPDKTVFVPLVDLDLNPEVREEFDKVQKEMDEDDKQRFDEWWEQLQQYNNNHNGRGISRGFSQNS